MVLITNFRWVFNHTLIVCVVLKTILISCNISRINRIINPSIHFKTLNPGVCNLETLNLLKNPSNLAFIPYTSRSSKHNYQNNKYVSYQNVEDTIKEGNYTTVRYEGLEPLYMKRPTTETHVSQVVKHERNASLFSGDFLGSRLRNFKESFNKLSKKDLVWVANKAGLFGVWYLGNVFYNVENRKLLNMFPVPITVAALQNLLTVPFMALRWFLNVEKPPEFYVPMYPLEKVDFKRDGFFSSVKKSLKNGLNRTRSYVRAYKTVLLHGTLSALVQTFTYLYKTSPFPPGSGYLRALEPLLVSLYSYLVENTTMPAMAYLSLLPVALGVAYATQGNFQPSNLSFSDLLKGVKTIPFLSLLAVVGLNSLRRDEATSYLRQNMDKVGKNVTATNLNVLGNMVGSLLMLPLALLDKENWEYAYYNATKGLGTGQYEFFKHLLLSSLAYGLVNQVNQLAFSEMSPVTQAVVQSAKNVMTMLTNSFFLERKLTKKELYGTALAIAGTLLYSLTKD